MSMADDYKRLSELEQTKGTLQYGQTLQVSPGPGSPDLVLASKDLIRWLGDKTDVNAWRVYLGPWQVRSTIVSDPALSTTFYANPTPWAPPEPRVFDSFAQIPVYARVQWGSGGVQHQAFIDWPRRGLLFQITGNYLQVNAFVDVGSPGVSIEQLPFLQATMGPEPGGGDATVPATYTYSVAAATMIGGGLLRWAFQIPPFARAFIPIYNALAWETYASPLTIATQYQPAAIGAIAGNDQSVWQLGGGGVYDPLFARDPFPIAGQGAGVVSMETALGIAPFAGCMFLLDL